MLNKNIKLSAIMLVCILIAVCTGIYCLTIKSKKIELPYKDDEKIVIGFSQLGAESDWRMVNTESVKSSFTEEKGYHLIIDDGQQKQSNQITAIRTFIQQGVDYILLAPVIETGWDTVLEEARSAGIPVIIVDRRVKVKDESLFSYWVGSDFELEGKKAVHWLKEYMDINEISPGDMHIINIQGTIGATAQIGRTKALEDASEKYGWDLMVETSGEFNRAKAREAMEKLLTEYNNINIVYCENDNEALGVIEAIEASGKKVGCDIKNGDIMIVSFDGQNSQAMNYVREKKIACITECDPHHGQRIEEIINSMENGIVQSKYNYVDGKIFSRYVKIQSIKVDTIKYDIIHEIVEGN